MVIMTSPVVFQIPMTKTKKLIGDEGFIFENMVCVRQNKKNTCV